jgi:acetyl-CoA acetyltransferase
MLAEKAEVLGLMPWVRVVATATAEAKSRAKGYDPIPATRKALARAAIELEDIGLIGLNEPLVVQEVAVMRGLGKCDGIT